LSKINEIETCVQQGQELQVAACMYKKNGKSP
jgi:hypothetical protein